MDKPVIFDLTGSMLIPRAFLYRIRTGLNRGGLCIMPSDTCYALVGIPVLRGVCDDINLILDRGREPISATFGTQRLAERFVNFNTAALHIIDEFAPGPITIVAPLKAGLPQELASALNGALNNPKREIAVRFPDSPAEVQLSSELERPLTTTAIYYRDKTPVRSFGDAVDIVYEGATAAGIERELYAVRRRRGKFLLNLSTVLEIDAPTTARGTRYTIFREGEVTEHQVRRKLAALDRYFVRRGDEWE
ncbi:Sua5/YciO/YrdC/YwlC family protein [Catellatospora sp. NPDC049111]|uniref:L-threonylcarbamoyladenylate synthase n=1 Tax=Catellatospora sp. NPDC049111 TaxID=3155271 RepID=UPI00340740E9